MKLAKLALNFFAVLAISVCLAPGMWAQATQAKPAKKKSSKSKPAAAATPVAAAAAPPESAPAPVVAKRDPFEPLINKKETHGPLPPGKAGLIIASVRVDGTVRAPSGMIAVVSNPDQRVYFLREGDRLYDGDVEKIGLDGVTFKENSKDAFGKAVERMVTKRIYPSAGEQQ